MDQPQDAARQPHPVSIILYGDAEPRLLDLEALARVEPAPDELLWVDLDAAPQETVEAVWQALRLDPQTRPSDPLKTSLACGSTAAISWRAWWRCMPSPSSISSARCSPSSPARISW